MKLATKLVYLVILVTIGVVPMAVWAIGAFNPDVTVDMNGVGGFVAGMGAPMGVLTGAMAARGISKDKARRE